MNYFLLVLLLCKLSACTFTRHPIPSLKNVDILGTIKSAAEKISDAIPTGNGDAFESKNINTSTKAPSPTEPSILKNIATSVVKNVGEKITDVIPTVKDIVSSDSLGAENDETKSENETTKKPSTLQNIGTSAINVIKGVAGKIPDVIPSAEDFFQYGKNIILGYPFEMVYSVINSFCSAALSTESVKPRTTPNVTSMNYVLKVGDRNISVPLNKPQKLWMLKEFNPRFPLVMVITGWTTTVNESKALDVIYPAYRCRGNTNFVTVDTDGFVDTLYSWSAFNTEEIGKVISESLANLVHLHPGQLQQIHLIGHSLGAHIAGSAGRNFYYKTRKLLPRITALDAANPCFNSGENLTGIQRGDAEFVLGIHSNSGGLGKRDPYGDADFYPNGVQPLPPGCLSMSCAHGRAPEYFAESVYPGNEYNFMGVKCGSLSSLNSNFCPGEPVPMGYATPQNLKGNYFLKTNEHSPYGLNATPNARPNCFNRHHAIAFLD